MTLRHHDLMIIGTGSGNSILTPELERLDVAIVERDVFGGTCLNRGCIPSKMLVYAADVAHLAHTGPDLGVHTRFDGADWKTIRDRVFGRIDPIAEAGERYRDEAEHVTVYRGTGRFVGNRTLQVGDETVRAEQVVLAAGARPDIPAIPGLGSVDFHTSDSIMRVDELPGHLVVLGGGFIGAELAHVFGALGSRVTIITRGDSMLRFEDDDIRLRFTECYRRRFDLLCEAQVLEVRDGNGDLELDVSVAGEHRTLHGDTLLVATGRRPNGDQLALQKTGVELDHLGFVVTDEHLRTTAPGVWALGDICNPDMLKHTANADARVVAHNVAHPDRLRAVDRRYVPHAVFGHPQVASVGLTERQARDRDLPYVVGLQAFGDTAYGWAMEDTTGLCKVIADPADRRILGAHIVGAQASTLLQPLVQAMQFGQTVDDVAQVPYYIHPALTEVVEQALLQL